VVSPPVLVPVRRFLVASRTVRKLVADRRVEFETESSPKGLSATRIRLG